MLNLKKFVAASSYLKKLHSLNVDTDPQSANVERLIEIGDRLSKAELEQAESLLLSAKVDFDYHWSLLLLDRSLNQASLGYSRTLFADATIAFALRAAWHKVIAKYKGLSHLKSRKGVVDGLFVFALGKLGGRDLNFSSDVDLIAFFDPEVLDVPDGLGKSYIAHQVLQQLTFLLARGGASDFVWRVDWRLRPNASATTLAMSTKVAMDYYFYRASPWHRLALLKARVVAGDMKLGNSFLSELTPFVWRQNLDFRALDELAEIKQRINAEHPGLRVQRQWIEPISDEVAGFNLKLGAGGIREVEFVVNALQLLWGGRDATLRTTNTLEGLSALGAGDYLQTEVVDQLSRAYSFLRNLENAVQLRANQHDHLLPQNQQGKDAFLCLSGFDDWQTMSKQLNAHRAIVNEVFSKLFAEQSSKDKDLPEWPSGLTEPAQEVIECWDAGYVCYGVSQEIRYRLKPLTLALSKYLADLGHADVSQVILALHKFFQSLPLGEQYFRLLASSPQLLGSIVMPLMHSPPMATLLRQSPHIIDCFVQRHWQWGESFDTNSVLQAASYEASLERLRRFVNEYLYQLYLAFLQQRLEPSAFQKALTVLAEQTLELSLKVVAKQMQLEKVPVALIGMGKLGLSCMAPMSDLDLIFIFDESDTDIQQATRFVSRLQTAISTPMREGIVYELDTRLRPSGRAGVPTVSLSSFAKHHRQRAHTWEHIALMPSRVVAGNLEFVEQLEDVKTEILKTKRQAQQSLNDMLKMYKRIEEHRIVETDKAYFNTKLRSGGLMQAEYLAACLVLARCNGRVDKDKTFDERLRFVLKEHELELLSAIDFWRILQLWERLLGLTEKRLDEVPIQYQPGICKHLSVNSLLKLEKKQAINQQIVLSAAESLFSETEQSLDIDSWEETKVQWFN